MPFPQTRTLFNKANIESINPGQLGCYGIFSAAGGAIYVGKGDIRDRLLAHVNGDNPCILRNAPSYYLTVLANPPDEMEKKLIIEYKPVCNQRVG